MCRACSVCIYGSLRAWWLPAGCARTFAPYGTVLVEGGGQEACGSARDFTYNVMYVDAHWGATK